MSFTIVPFATEHIEHAAALVAGCYATLRRKETDLPARYEDAAVFEPMLLRTLDSRARRRRHERRQVGGIPPRLPQP